MSLPEQLRKLAARRYGFTPAEVDGHPLLRVQDIAAKLTAKGQLHRVVNGKKQRRYFTSIDDRDAYARLHGLAVPPRPPARQAAAGNVVPQRPQKAIKVKTDGQRLRAAWGPDEPADYSRAVWHACPPMPGPRFQAIDLPGAVGLQRGRVS